MPHHLTLLLTLSLMLPGALAGQSGSAGWSFTAGVDGIRFGAVAQDTTGLAAAAPDLRPSGRIGVRASIRRSAGPWQVGLVVGWADGNAEAANEAVAIRDRTVDLDRYRAGLLVARELTRVGAGGLSVEVSPVLDLWSVSDETRTRFGAEGALLLALPVGPIAVEHRLAFGVSASPIEQQDVGEEFELKPLRSVGYGVGVRVPL